MRKSAPALLLTTIFALASGSALALGDRNKEKKAADTATPSSQSAATPSTSGSADPRCDESKYTSRSAMPKDCLDKLGTGASATGSTAQSSGGNAGPGGSAGSAGSSGAGGSSSGSSSSSGK